jgi:hypothetical protein
MKVLNRISRRVALTLLVVAAAASWHLCYAEDKLNPGNQYRIVGPVYLGGIYRNLNDRQLTKEKAFVDISAVRYSGPEVAFQCKVPPGTTMTILGAAPKVWHLPFLPNRYFVRLAPTILTLDLDIILELRGTLEGDLDGLNQNLFARAEAGVKDSTMTTPSPISPCEPLRRD